MTKKINKNTFNLMHILTYSVTHKNLNVSFKKHIHLLFCFFFFLLLFYDCRTAQEQETLTTFCLLVTTSCLYINWCSWSK